MYFHLYNKPKYSLTMLDLFCGQNLGAGGKSSSKLKSTKIKFILNPQKKKKKKKKKTGLQKKKVFKTIQPKILKKNKKNKKKKKKKKKKKPVFLAEKLLNTISQKF